MSETKTLLHAEPKAETYSYKIEETAEHLTVVRLERSTDRQHWHYHVTAERLAAAPGRPAGETVQGDAEGFAQYFSRADECGPSISSRHSTPMYEKAMR